MQPQNVLPKLPLMVVLGLLFSFAVWSLLIPHWVERATVYEASALTFSSTSSINNALPVPTDGDPHAAALDVKGVYHFAFVSSTGVFNNIYLTTSTDGSSWGDPIVISEDLMSSDSSWYGSFDFIYDGGSDEFYLTYVASSSGAVFGSSDDAHTWVTSSLSDTLFPGWCSSVSDQLRVANATDSSLLVVACSYEEWGTPEQNPVVVIATSTDGGASWSTTTTVDTAVSSTWQRGFRQMEVKVSGSAGAERIHVMYEAESESNGSQILYASSTDLGGTFSTTTVEVLEGHPEVGGGAASETSRLQIMEDGTPTIVYQEIISVTGTFPTAVDFTIELVYAEDTGSGWTTTTIDVINDVINFMTDGESKLVDYIIHSGEFPVILYRDNNRVPVIYTNTSSVYTSTTVENTSIIHSNAGALAYSTSSAYLSVYYPAGGEYRFTRSIFRDLDLVPPTPTGASATTLSTTSLRYDWNDVYNESVFVAFVRLGDTTDAEPLDNIVTAQHAETATFTGLQPGTMYTLSVYGANGHGGGAEAFIGPSYTFAATSSAPTVSAASSTALDIGITDTINGSSTRYALHIYGTSLYVDAAGSATDTPVYQTTSTWGASVTLDGLGINDLYGIGVIARNGDNVNAATSTYTFAYTHAVAPVDVTAVATGETTSTLTFTVGTGNPTTTEHAIYEINAGKWVATSTFTTGEGSPVWAVTSTWFSSGDPLTLTGLTEDTEYCFGVAARNGDDIETSTTTATCITTDTSEDAEVEDDDDDSPSTGGGSSKSGGGSKPTLKTPEGETVDPEDALLINDGDATTASQSVTLSIAESNATQMAISEDEDFGNASFVNFDTEVSFTLSDGNGVKTVYVKLKKGGSSVTVSDSIELTGQSFDAPDPEDGDDPSDCALPTKSAYKAPDSTSVYYITSSCTKRAFISANTYATYFPVGTPTPPNADLPTIPTPDWSKVGESASVNDIPEDSLGFMPWGPYYNPQFGALVKQPNDSKVYLLLNGEKNWITDPEVFEALNYQWGWIEDVHEDLLPNYTTGEEIDYTDHHPDYSVIKYADDTAVYQLQDQKKRWIPTPEVFNSLNFRWDRIITVPDTEVYPDGEDLS